MGVYSLLADAVLVLHATFMLFVVGGQALILAGWARRWHWIRGRRFRWLHLGAIGYVVLESWLGLVCPLTEIENRLRRLGDGVAYTQGFIHDWVHRLLFYDAPSWVFGLVYTLFFIGVLLSYRFCPPRH